MLGKLPLPGRPTNLNYNRARAYCADSRCGRVFFFFFFLNISLSSITSVPLSLSL